MKFFRRTAAVIVAATLATTGLVACSSDEENNGESIRIGTTDSAKNAWNVFKEEAEKEGIDLEVVNFSDYTTPNKALSEGKIDVNLFQHLKFLAEYNIGTGDDLKPVGATEIVPLALFWKDHDSLDGIDGEEIAIPNDSSNQGRAINVLVQAGLLKLKKEGLITPTPADIDKDASKVSVIPIEATQTTAAYAEGRPAIINNTFLDRANIDPKTAVFQDDPTSKEAEPYINVFVTKADNTDNETVAKLVDVWHSDAVQDANAQDSRGTSVSVQRSAEELQEILERIENAQRAAE